MASKDVTDAQLEEQIQVLLCGRDLASTSLKQVRADLEKHFSLSAGTLDSRKDKVKELVAAEITRMQSQAKQDADPDGEEAEAEAEAEEDAAEEAKEPSASQGSKKAREEKKRKSSTGSGKEGKGKGKLRDRQSSCMSRKEFMKKAKTITVTIGDKQLKAEPKLFSTGSCGFMASSKVPVEVDGQTLVLQCGLNLPVIGSKEWAD
ncbi:glcK [Symbiodinium pilosum]|uniref:GlcK protein n=1 Tax=Symbiodinium pilosum TaxID=2952 RepID=A0A812PYL7_SYMPI|nr:glcK [Symbiodinium pilosum]